MSLMSILHRSSLLLAAAVMVVSSEPASTAEPSDRTPLVYAAASLTEVLQTINDDFAREHGRTVRFSFASTATLARQIEAGARADVFVSADQEWMDYLAARQLIRADSRRNLLQNSLVLVAPADSRVATVDFTATAFTAALGTTGRIAMADAASVPAGRYAKAALQTLGLWDRFATRTIAAENVRAALQFVARGETPLGIVYLTDAMADSRVRIVGRFAPGTHPAIVYPAALTTRASPAAREFLEFLATPTAQKRFEAAGFLWLGATRASLAPAKARQAG